VAVRVLNDMETMFGVAPDERTYRKAIIACNQAEHDKRRRERRGLDTKHDEDVLQWWECALSLLRRMKESRLYVDPQTYSSVISACEAAGQWQRALGVLQSMMKSKNQAADGYSQLNLYCFNAAISACEKGGAWVEALELYYRMKDKGGEVTPNFVTLSSLLLALDKAGQKELAQSTYEEGIRDGIMTPWKITRKSSSGQMIRAMVSVIVLP
jgi:pentatricopeptide repeat domain-containing protein 1